MKAIVSPALLLAAGAHQASASTVVFISPPGQTEVHVQAMFSAETASQSLSIQLLNERAKPAEATRPSRVALIMSNAPAALLAALASSSGWEVNSTELDVPF